MENHVEALTQEALAVALRQVTANPMAYPVKWRFSVANEAIRRLEEAHWYDPNESANAKRR